MIKLFSTYTKKGRSKKLPVIIVSGLPRSGTSMMMKMLVEGGLQAVMDGLREADNDNPNGYFEFEAVKELSKGNLHWVDDAEGKVVKVISSLLEYLPTDHSYKIVFMEREISEVLASQQKMLTNRNEESTTNDTDIKQQFQDHLKTVKAWLIRQPSFDVMYVNFNLLMKDPAQFCSQIADFIGLPLNIENMKTVPNTRLYRNHSKDR